MTDYLDTPARSLEELRAEVAAELREAERYHASLGFMRIIRATPLSGISAQIIIRLRARLAQIEAEIKARETKP